MPLPLRRNLLIRRTPILPILLGGVIAESPHLLELIINIREASLGSERLHLLQLDLRDILMQFRREAQPLLPFLLIPLRIIEVDQHAIILHILLRHHRAPIRKGRLRFIAINHLLLLVLPQ